MAGLKAFAGIVGNSTALIADALHSLSDLVSDVVALYVLKVSSLPPDLDHPFGHGKFESLGSLTLSAVLVGTGFGIGVHALGLLQPMLDQSHILTPLPTTLALGVCVFSIFAKEALYYATANLAKRFNSNLVLANAWHHRVDALTSVVALVGIVGAKYGFPILDPIAALFVSGMIIRMGVITGIDSVKDLTDTQADQIVSDKILNELNLCSGVKSIHKLRVRRMGGYLVADVHISVDVCLSVTAAHQIAVLTKQQILAKIPEVSDFLIHVDPDEDIFQSEYHPMDLPSCLEIQKRVESILFETPEVKLKNVTVHLKNRILEVEIILYPNGEYYEDQLIASLIRKKVMDKIPEISKLDISRIIVEDSPQAN